jgi:hypothetical protein
VTHAHVTRSGIALTFALMLLTPPGSAGAACGGVQRAYPAKEDGRRFAPPLAIGDSVMLGAVGHLARAGLEVDARGCRQMREGLALMRRRRRAGTLPSRVVIALGANWTVRPGELRAALRIAGRRRLLVLVTPRESGGGSGPDAGVMRRVARRFPRRVRLLDWVRRSAGHPGWFAGDGLHLSHSGRRAFARFLRRATRWEPPVSPGRRRGASGG